MGTVAPPHPVPEFLLQLTKMLTDDNGRYIEWKSGSVFVHNPPGLEKEVLGRYFRHSDYTSFQRQMNYFGFRKIAAGEGKMTPCSYVNEAAKDDISSILYIASNDVYLNMKKDPEYKAVMFAYFKTLGREVTRGLPQTVATKRVANEVLQQLKKRGGRIYKYRSTGSYEETDDKGALKAIRSHLSRKALYHEWGEEHPSAPADNAPKKGADDITLFTAGWGNNWEFVVQEWVQCEKCQKWRGLPPHISPEDLPDEWYCSMNTWGIDLATCTAVEGKQITVGRDEEEASSPLQKSPGNRCKSEGCSKNKRPGHGYCAAHYNDSTSPAPEGKKKRRGPGWPPGSKNTKPPEGKKALSAGEKRPPKQTCTDGGKDKQMQEWVQCERCEKWRRLPPRISAEALPDVWYCSMSTWDINRATCAAVEDKHQVNSPLRSGAATIDARHQDMKEVGALKSPTSKGTRVSKKKLKSSPEAEPCEDLGAGWTKKVYSRSASYYSPDGRQFRSMKEVMRYLNRENAKKLQETKGSKNPKAIHLGKRKAPPEETDLVAALRARLEQEKEKARKLAHERDIAKASLAEKTAMEDCLVDAIKKKKALEADLEEVRGDLDVEKETVKQQLIATDSWQSRFDELAARAAAGPVDGAVIAEIRGRPLASGSAHRIEDAPEEKRGHCKASGRPRDRKSHGEGYNRCQLPGCDKPQQKKKFMGYCATHAKFVGQLHPEPSNEKSLKPLLKRGAKVYAAYWPPEDPKRNADPEWYPATISSYKVGAKPADGRYGSVRFYNVKYDDGDSLTNIPDHFVFPAEEYLLSMRLAEANPGKKAPSWKGVKNVTDKKSKDSWAKHVGWFEATIDGETEFSLLADALRAYDASVVRAKGLKTRKRDLNLPEDWAGLLGDAKKSR